MKPGAAQARVTQLPPRSRRAPFWRPSARSCSVSISSSSASMSSRSRCGLGSGASGVEELDILLLPGDADLLALPATEGRILLPWHLRQHALAAGDEVQLHEIAQELHEDDLTLGRVAVSIRFATDLDRGSADRHECGLADGGCGTVLRTDGDTDVVLVLDDDAAAVAR